MIAKIIIKTILFAGFLITAILGFLMAVVFVGAKYFYASLDAPNFLENVSLLMYFCPGLLVLTSIIGFFTLCYEKANKLFAIAALITIILGLIVLMKIPTEADTTSRFSEILREDMKLYDWRDDTRDWNETQLTPVQNATRLWDNLQSVAHCCGLNEPIEWGGSNPDSEKYGMYPKSCCDQPELDAKSLEYVCDSVGLRQYRGCIKRLAVPLIGTTAVIRIGLILIALPLAYIRYKYKIKQQNQCLAR